MAHPSAGSDIAYVAAAILKKVVDARTLDLTCNLSRSRTCTQRVRLEGVCTAKPWTEAGVDAYEWVEDWIIEHTAEHPPALLISAPSRWRVRTRRKLRVRIFAPDGACLNDDLVDSGLGWRV